MLTAKLTESLRTICTELGYMYPDGVVITEPPSRIATDFSCNIAMLLVKQAQGNPREIAEGLKEKLIAVDGIQGVEIAGPGFLNISLSNSWYEQILMMNLTRVMPAEVPEKIDVEYISANPSGPLHIGNARGGPVGETIARALEARGHTVERDFYINDVGGQADKFAASVLHYYLLHFGHDSTFPEKGYPAPYVQELAGEIVRNEGERIAQLPEDQRVEAMRQVAIPLQVAKILQTVERMNIHFDIFCRQSELQSSGLSKNVLEELQQRDATLKKDGAVWLKSGFQDDDRESVLVKQNGENTYFVDDIAYHKDKLITRGFSRAIVLLGSNHSGHLPRMRASMQALGIDPERYQAVIYQYVQLKEGGETKRMAKREGTFVTTDDVLDEVPLDVFNYFMLSKANETHLDFDLQLAKDTSEKNPIYYIQYAHARICSVLSRAEEGQLNQEVPGSYDFAVEERELLRHLANFSPVVAEVGESFRTHLLPTYLHELATRYHHFYAKHRILTENVSETAVRLRLSQQTAEILRNGLALLNIVALEKM